MHAYGSNLLFKAFTPFYSCKQLFIILFSIEIGFRPFIPLFLLLSFLIGASVFFAPSCSG